MVVIKIVIDTYLSMLNLKVSMNRFVKLRILRYLINVRDVICVIMLSNNYCDHFILSKFKYISNYVLIYAQILKSFNHLDILHADV